MDASRKTENNETADSREKCGGWRLLREIGRGAYGTVHLAEGPDGRLAALKVCRHADLDDERYARELRGAKLYMSVSQSEGLIGMREVVEEDWGFYSVMDLADDEFDRADASPESYRPKTLAKVIEGEKALPLKECARLGIALAKGLAALQRHHLLHRDIKPGNVLYIGGKPVLSDPRLLVEEAEAASLVGTPGYVPPEKFTDSASDIYSLGLTLKAASFGRRVEDLDKGPAQEADTGARFFPAWWRILNKATDADASRRHQSAKALLKDLLTLRRKIALAAFLSSRPAKIACVLAALCIAVGVAVSINSAKQKAVSEAHAMQEAAIREMYSVLPEKEREDMVLRIMSNGRLSEDWGHLEHIYVENYGASNSYMDILKISIEKIGKVDKAKAERLQQSYDDLAKNLAELNSKNASLQKEIILLHSKAIAKVKSGFDDKEEYGKAQKIYEERSMLFKEIYPKIEAFAKAVWEAEYDCGLKGI